MVSTHDSRIIEIWLQKQPSRHTRCYRYDSEQLLNHAKNPLSRITLADLQSFAQSLANSGLAPISRARTLAAVKSLFGFCVRMRHLAVNPAAELTLPAYENCLAERILAEEDV
jgi:site-specific recombinase XerD